MIPQQFVQRDGRWYLIETTIDRTVSEVTKDGTGLAVSDDLAAELIETAERNTADRAESLAPQNELSERLIARFEMDVLTVADPFVRAAVAYVVDQFLTKPGLLEELDRMQAGGAA